MDSDNETPSHESDIVAGEERDADLVSSESQTFEIDITGDGKPDGFRSVTTESREFDLDGDGMADVFETVTIEQTSIDVDGDGVPDVITTVETSEVQMDLTGDGDTDSVEVTEIRTVAHDIDADGMPNVTRTDVVTASAIDPKDGHFQDVETAGVRIYGLDTTGDGVIDEVSAEELDVEVVEDTD